ncbi:tripartite tricarboxylate transporter TctB family protein [Stappia sp. 28M-7]|uniref:tripartite tricarboxylate transporter TctB family protein n=1 Tax=Stappia sp. 28M-7 TaxID=2762596 RepID=UPI00163CEF05|nr:tripartite tricarboxylate transporter TctB family protein [Stappia sp. 28M-7]MBC2859995.1 tripartite tricarboxylate transporter TctB family protein [Stappia sp. 28M-7]
MTRRVTGQVLFAFVLLGLNTVYASQVLIMPFPFVTGEPGPAFMPMLLCGFVYVAVLKILVDEFRSPEPVPDAERALSAIPRVGIVGPLVAITLISLFVIVFFYAGYIVAAALYTFAISLFFNYEQSGSWGRSVIFAVLTSAAITVFGWLFFVKLFGLYLPMWEL